MSGLYTALRENAASLTERALTPIQGAIDTSLLICNQALLSLSNTRERITAVALNDLRPIVQAVTLNGLRPIVQIAPLRTTAGTGAFLAVQSFLLRELPTVEYMTLAFLSAAMVSIYVERRWQAEVIQRRQQAIELIDEQPSVLRPTLIKALNLILPPINLFFLREEIENARSQEVITALLEQARHLFPQRENFNPHESARRHVQTQNLAIANGNGGAPAPSQMALKVLDLVMGDFTQAFDNFPEVENPQMLAAAISAMGPRAPDTEQEGLFALLTDAAPNVGSAATLYAAQRTLAQAKHFVAEASWLTPQQKEQITDDLTTLEAQIDNGQGVSALLNGAMQAIERSTEPPADPTASLNAGFIALEEIDPPEGVGTDDTDVQRAKEEFAETLRFWSAYEYYQVLLSTFASPDREGSFTRIMREVVAVGRDITDPAARYALRKEKFLTELVGGEARAESRIYQSVLDAWAYVKKYIIVGTVLYIIEFYAEVFTANSMDYVEKVLRTISNQNSDTPEDAIEIRHILYADEALNNLKNARRSWARDPRGGNAEMHLGPLLGSEFGFNRDELYRFAGTLGVDTFIPSFGHKDRVTRLQPQGEYLVNTAVESTAKRYVGFDLMSQYMVRLENLAHTPEFSLFEGNENVGPLGRLYILLTRLADLPMTTLSSLVNRLESENLSAITLSAEKLVRTLAATLLFYLPYIILSCFDRAVHSLGTFFIKKVIADQQQIIKQIIEGTRDGMTLDRPQQYELKKQMRDQLYNVCKEMQDAGTDEPHRPMPNKLRDALKTLLATTQSLVMESECRTQEELAASMESSNAWTGIMPGLASVFKDKIYEEAIEQLTSVVGAAISANMEEDKRNVYLTMGIRAAENSLTKIDVLREVSDAEIAELDREIKVLRKRLTDTIIDRSVAELIEGSSNETARREALGLLQSAETTFLGDDGLCAKWTTLLTQFENAPLHHPQDKMQRADALHKNVVAFGDHWIAIMGSIASNDKIPADMKRDINDRFKPLNELFVKFEGENAAEEMRRHRADTYHALHSGKPLREGVDITANLAHIKRASLYNLLLTRARAARESIERSVISSLQLIDSESFDKIKDALEIHSTALSNQIRELKKIKNLESLRVYDRRRDDGSQISSQEFRETFFTPLEAMEATLNGAKEDIYNATETLSSVKRLRSSNNLEELTEKAKASLPSSSLLGRLFLNSDCKGLIAQITAEHVAHLPASEEKRALIHQLNEVGRCKSDDEVDAAIATIRTTLTNMENKGRETLGTIAADLTQRQNAINEMFGSKRETWENGITIDGAHIPGYMGLEAHIQECTQRLREAFDAIPARLPQTQDFEQAFDAMVQESENGSITQTLLSASIRPLLPRLKNEIAKFVIQKTDVMMGIMDKGYAIQAVLDQATLAFVRSETGDTKFPREAHLIQAEEAP